mmetsp:Transcript_13801/g.16756  ORF Transcript_13801/g.16756 Transcript_13801/m.16756 type:complete len:100 (-) Transcript_13801:106-405(-)
MVDLTVAIILHFVKNGTKNKKGKKNHELNKIIETTPVNANETTMKEETEQATKTNKILDRDNKNKRYEQNKTNRGNYKTHEKRNHNHTKPYIQQPCKKA